MLCLWQVQNWWMVRPQDWTSLHLITRKKSKPSPAHCFRRGNWRKRRGEEKERDELGAKEQGHM